MDHLDVHQAAARQGRQRERAHEGQHRDAHGVHQPVARRERRHGLPARLAVGRHRADEAAARRTAPIPRSPPRWTSPRCTSPPASAGWRASPTSGRQQATLEAVKLLLDLGLDPNAAGRHRPHGAARRRPQGPRRRHPGAGRSRRQARRPRLRQHRQPRRQAGRAHLAAVDYADGLVRVGVQSAIAHPEAGLLLRKLMIGQGTAGAAGRTHARVDLHHRSLRVAGLTSGERARYSIAPLVERSGERGVP